MSDAIEEVLKTPFTFDLSRCNHLGKTVIDCPHCLRHRLHNVETALAQLEEAASMMPTRTMTGGSNCTIGEYSIQHGTVWGLDIALRRAKDVPRLFGRAAL